MLLTVDSLQIAEILSLVFMVFQLLLPILFVCLIIYLYKNHQKATQKKQASLDELVATNQTLLKEIEDLKKQQT